MTDLDHVRRAVDRAKERVAGLAPLPLVTALESLADKASGNPEALAAIKKSAKAPDQHALTQHLANAASAFVPSVAGLSVDAAIASLRDVKTRAEEQVFPLGALTPPAESGSAPIDLTELRGSIAAYSLRLAEVDSDAARLMPIFESVLAHHDFADLAESVSCPVCEDGALSPARVALMRTRLMEAAGMQRAAHDVIAHLDAALREVDRVGTAMRTMLPAAANWDTGRWRDVSAHLALLVGGDEIDLGSEGSARGNVARSLDLIDRHQQMRVQLTVLVDAAMATVNDRRPLDEGVVELLAMVNDAMPGVSAEMAKLSALTISLQEALGEQLHTAPLPVGTREILDLLEHSAELHHELLVQRQRKTAKQRIDATSRAVAAGEKALIDDRFDKMGAEIDYWWATLRPDELVRFGGVGRRASGRRYVNLTAELATSADAVPEVRDAVGVFSDSQLNALGLSAFLARQRLLQSPIVVLDDPLPGYDPEHRVTFTLNTLGALADAGVQVVVCTHDPKLAVNIVEVQQHRGLGHFELALSDMVEGTTVTNDGDVFGRHVLEAQDSIASLTLQGRRNAANALRRAAERLAKQIIATGRTEAGTATRVSEVGDKTLGELIPDVLGFALGNDERGRWNLWKSSLNPGAHDDDVPVSTTLKTVLGDIKKLRKSHESHWPGGLLK